MNPCLKVNQDMRSEMPSRVLQNCPTAHTTPPQRRTVQHNKSLRDRHTRAVQRAYSNLNSVRNLRLSMGQQRLLHEQLWTTGMTLSRPSQMSSGMRSMKLYVDRIS